MKIMPHIGLFEIRVHSRKRRGHRQRSQRKDQSISYYYSRAIALHPTSIQLLFTASACRTGRSMAWAFRRQWIWCAIFERPVKRVADERHHPTIEGTGAGIAFHERQIAPQQQGEEFVGPREAARYGSYTGPIVAHTPSSMQLLAPGLAGRVAQSVASLLAR